MYEHRDDHLLPFNFFLRRVFNHGGAALGIIVVSLAIGVIGYHLLAGLTWIDSLLNASMLLGGEGPVDKLENAPAKIFASVYALYSGLVLLVSVGILSAPIIHRILHSLNIRQRP